MALPQQQPPAPQPRRLDMWQAAAADDVDGLRGLVEVNEEGVVDVGNPVDLLDDFGRTALHVAASRGYILFQWCPCT